MNNSTIKMQRNLAKKTCQPLDRAIFSKKQRQAGFSMLEVLISLVLIAFTLLGQAGLQASALKLNKSADLRIQAVILADEISERIEANKTIALAGAYMAAHSSTPASASADCLAANCTAASLASFDLSTWQTRVAATLPDANWQITHAGTNPSTYTIVLSWTDRRDNAKSVNYATAGTTETMSLTTNKVVTE